MNGTIMFQEGDVLESPPTAVATGEARLTETTPAAEIAAGEIGGDDRAQWSALPDGKRSQLRALMRDLDRSVSALGTTTTVAVTSAVRRLAAALDLGPEPELVACPVCQRLGIVDAARCGYCWTSLLPAGD